MYDQGHFTTTDTKPREQPNTKVTGGNSTMTKHEEFLWELVLHESEMKAELTRLYLIALRSLLKQNSLRHFSCIRNRGKIVGGKH